MKTMQILLFVGVIWGAMLACGAPPAPAVEPDGPAAGPVDTPIPTATARPVALEDVVDQARTDQRLYQERFFTYHGDPFEPVESTVVPLLPTEVLYGMLRCAEGAAGTSIWRFLDPTWGDFYIYIWDAGVAEGGFAYVNGEGIVPNGMNAPVFEIADLLTWMRNDGWKEIRPSKLPASINADAIQEAIRQLPASVPLWQAPANLFLLVFPGAMIYFQAPGDGGGA